MPKYVWTKQPSNQWYLKSKNRRYIVEQIAGEDDKWRVSLTIGSNRHALIFETDTWIDGRDEAFAAAEQLIDNIEGV